MQVFPGDDFTAEDIRVMIDQLVAAGLVLQYFADGKEYWHVTGWHHQKIEKRAYKYPRPDEIVDQSTTSRQPVVDNSPPDVDVDVDVGVVVVGTTTVGCVELSMPSVAAS